MKSLFIPIAFVIVTLFVKRFYGNEATSFFVLGLFIGGVLTLIRVYVVANWRE